MLSSKYHLFTLINTILNEIISIPQYIILNHFGLLNCSSCERNESTFKTFQLNNLVDLSQLNGMNDYPQLKYTIEVRNNYVRLVIIQLKIV